jgi:glycosyltransferase involved in cell wall biosynthesis
MIKIPVVTVVFNNKKTIEDTIKSVLSQTHKNIEHIIVDGKSTDGTLDVIKKYKKSISKYISEEDNGIYDAMNKGVKMCTGDLIYFLNSDDIFYDNQVLGKVAEVFEKNRKYDYFYGGVVSRGIFNSGRDNIFLKEISSHSIKMGQNIPHQSLFVPKSAFEEIGLFDSNLKVNGDYDFECRLIKTDKAGFFLNHLIAYYNQNGYSSRGGFDTYKEKISIIKKHFGFIYASLYSLKGISIYIMVLLLKKLGIAGFVSNVMNQIRGTFIKSK